MKGTQYQNETETPDPVSQREPAAFGIDDSIRRRPMHQPTPKDVVVELYERFDRGDLGSFQAVDGDFAATVFGTTVLDWPSFVAFGQSFVDAFPNGRHEFDFVVAEGDAVATIGHYRGRHEGELMSVPATGRDVDFTVMHIDRVRDGRIIEHRGIGDINAMWTQLGVDPPSAD
jgi:predicted ester cyclase